MNNIHAISTTRRPGGEATGTATRPKRHVVNGAHVARTFPNGEGTATRRSPGLIVGVFKWTAWLGFQLVLSFVLLELFSRVANPLGIAFYPELARHLDHVFVKEEPIGYHARPGNHGKYFGSEITINSHGLRDRELTLPPAVGEYRVLVMGDSTPYGIGVEYEDSYPHQLELIANERHVGARQYRMINMGLISYNTEQELIQLKSLGLKFQPKLVTLLFSKNDIEPKMWIFDRRASYLTNLAQRSYAASLLYVLKGRALTRVTGVEKDIFTPLYRKDGQLWQTVDRSLSEMNQVCRDAGIDFVVFAVEKSGDVARDQIDEVGRREGFPVVTLDLDADPNWRANPAKYRNSSVDSHPNKAGCRIYAERMYAGLTDLGLIN